MIASPAQTQTGMALDDYIREYEEQPFELTNGEKVVLMPAVFEHTIVLKFLYKLLLKCEEAFATIAVFSETPFVLADTPHWVRGSRVPDIMVYRAEQIQVYQATMPDYASKPLVLVPALCVEIVSQNDSYIELEEKVDNYLHDGVEIVWLVNPRQRSVTIFTADGLVTRLVGEAVLSSVSLLPDFAVRVSELFQSA
jgi:Uma2 family endonuclease